MSWILGQASDAFSPVTPKYASSNVIDHAQDGVEDIKQRQEHMTSTTTPFLQGMLCAQSGVPGAWRLAGVPPMRVPRCTWSLALPW